MKIGLADAYMKASQCLDIEDRTKRSLGVYYLEEALKLISSLPPDIRNIEYNLNRSGQYREQLNSMLERDE